MLVFNLKCNVNNKVCTSIDYRPFYKYLGNIIESDNYSCVKEKWNKMPILTYDTGTPIYMYGMT